MNERIETLSLNDIANANQDDFSSAEWLQVMERAEELQGNDKTADEFWKAYSNARKAPHRYHKDNLKGHRTCLFCYRGANARVHKI